MNKVSAIILAAGEGKRMKTKQSKVAHKICGKSLVEWVISSLEEAEVKDSVVVVGHMADQVREILGNRTKFATQDKQLGTGHAVMQAEGYLKDFDGHVIVLCGDTPLITSQTITNALKAHIESKNSATVITAVVEDPTGYGRIVRSKNGDVQKIVEHKDASEKEKTICEINSGMYCFSVKSLLTSLKELDNNNSQGEYYLTDTLEILMKKGEKVGADIVADPREILGINDRVQLAEAAEIMRKRIQLNLMKSGVTIIDPASTYIEADVKIGMDTIVYPGTILEGSTVIGEDCIIGPNSRMVDSIAGNCTTINNSVVLESTVGNNTNVGPFAYIRPQSVIGDKVKIGDFVEVKKSVIGDKTKLSHLTYVGDAEIGKNVNMGCGVVVVNYDGVKKNKTVVGDNSFVGCNVNLVSPVVVNQNAYIAAGSTITDEVPEYALAIARARQENKEDWVNKKGFKRKK